MMKSLKEIIYEKNVTQEETENEIKIHIDKLIVNNTNVEDIVKELINMGYDSSLINNLIKSQHMKNLKEYLNENLIVEAAAKDLHNPRKGSTVYILKQGDTKAIPVKIESVNKSKKSQMGSFDITVNFEENTYKLGSYVEYHFGTIEYKEPKKVISGTWQDPEGIFYIGVSKEAIQEYITSKAAKNLKDIMNQIADKEKELAELYRKKDKYEIEANTQISESLNESKKINEKDLRRTIEIHLDTIYNDGYNSPQEARKALKELAEKGDGDMLDYLTSSIDSHDGDITEDDLMDNWDEYVDLAKEIANEWLK